MKNYDIAVVGAGPIGSTIAYELSKESYSVALFDKKEDIGYPLQCAGIVDKNISNLNEIPEEFIINKVKGANIFSPKGEYLEVSKKSSQAYVLDRINYDKFLLNRAISNGVSFFNSHKLNSLDRINGTLKFDNGKTISAEVIVGCDGSISFCSNSLNNKQSYFFASQYLIEIEKELNHDFVYLFLNGKISPGFIWFIPLSKKKFRLGLFSKLNIKNEMKVLDDFLYSNPLFKNYTILNKYHGIIPKFDFNKTIAKDRLILLGDAASQVKPTSGGGLNLGFKCSYIAKEAIINFLNNPEKYPLENYQDEVYSNLENEINKQMKLHKTFALLDDNDFNAIVNSLKKNSAEDIISEYGEIDEQSKLIKEAIKRGWFISLAPKMFLNRITKLWNLK